MSNYLANYSRLHPIMSDSYFSAIANLHSTKSGRSLTIKMTEIVNK
ncbi:hypothetical protein [Pseudanabaena sp. PCC 6802]|nr:hypothetical protein [Pseudanabaena sp. PCC 6802]